MLSTSLPKSLNPLLALPFTLALALAVSPALEAAPKVELVAGEGKTEPLKVPFAVDFDGAGNLYGVEFQDGNRVFKISAEDNSFAFIGGRESSTSGKDGDISEGDGGPLKDAVFNGVHELAVAENGDLYIADTWCYRVRKVDATSGIITTIAGTGKKGFSGDGGPAAEAQISGVYSLCLSADDQRLYLCDLDNRRIRKIDLQTGLITTVAGNGEQGIPKDGTPATGAPLVNPRAVAVTSDETLYILSRGGNALRVVDPKTATIKTVVNASGKKGATGDNGPALEATLNGPKHLCIAPDDKTVYIADAENHLIRRYDPNTATIHPVAGIPNQKATSLTDGLDGPPETCPLNRPHGVRFGPEGLLYIVDSYSNRVLKLAE